ncbi:MAG TPA: fatty acid desaturase [Aquella sp.]|nr:fatty acid desaturase [Aquella sp.]
MNCQSIKLTSHQLKQLSHYSIWKQFGRLFFIFLLYVATAVIGYKINNMLIWFFVWGIQGLLLACCLVVVHDGAHGTFIRSRTVCRFLGVVVGSLLLVNFSLYRCLHLEHHRHTNVAGDTQRPRQYSNIWHYFISIFHLKFPYRFIELSIKSMLDKFPSCARSDNLRLQIKQDSMFFLVIVCVQLTIMVLYPRLFFSFYGIPIMFYLIYTFFLTTAEHSGCDNTDNPLRNVRTVMSNPIFRFLFWNFNYHAEHHAYPSVPAPNLIHVHRLLGTNFAHVEKSYIAVHLKLLQIIVKKDPLRART